MFAKLTGHIDSLFDDWLILDVNGVGYRVAASARTLDGLRGVSDPVALLIETQVREDAITLYGFKTSADQDLFRLLTSVQGVGAKVALAIQSVLTADQIILALSAQDKVAISRANGVGPKLAGRIVNELKEKVAAFSSGGQMPAARPGPSSGKDVPGEVGDAGGLRADLTSALTNLGYRPSDALQAAASVLSKAEDGASLESLIPKALKELG